jgi:hypothetical protein
MLTNHDRIRQVAATPEPALLRWTYWGGLAVLFVGTGVAATSSVVSGHLDIPLLILVASVAFTLSTHALISLWGLAAELSRLPLQVRKVVWGEVGMVLAGALFWLVPLVSVTVVSFWSGSGFEMIGGLTGPLALFGLGWTALAFLSSYTGGLQKAREQATLHLQGKSPANLAWQQDQGRNFNESRSPPGAIQIRDQFTERGA